LCLDVSVSGLDREDSKGLIRVCCHRGPMRLDVLEIK
jgi:hypothetical protein